MDDCWMENVGPLISALEELGIDPVEWAEEPDHSVFTYVPDDGTAQLGPTLRPEIKPMGMYDQVLCDINFACGYLQATGNLTGRTWAEQMAEGLKKETTDDR